MGEGGREGRGVGRGGGGLLVCLKFLQVVS